MQYCEVPVGPTVQATSISNADISSFPTLNTRSTYGCAPTDWPPFRPSYPQSSFPYDEGAAATGPPVQYMPFVTPLLVAPENTRPTCGYGPTYVPPVPSAHPGSRYDGVAGTVYPQHWRMEQSKTQLSWWCNPCLPYIIPIVL